MSNPRFEDLPVWQLAARLFDRTEIFLDRAPGISATLRNHLQATALSIPSSIAEGFERGTKADLLHFISAARGGAGNFRSAICILQRRTWPADIDAMLDDLRKMSETCSRQLRSWLEVVRKSEICEPGPTREPLPKRLEKLVENLPPDNPLRHQKYIP